MSSVDTKQSDNKTENDSVIKQQDSVTNTQVTTTTNRVTMNHATRATGTSAITTTKATISGKAMANNTRRIEQVIGIATRTRTG